MVKKRVKTVVGSSRVMNSMMDGNVGRSTGPSAGSREFPVGGIITRNDGWEFLNPADPAFLIRQQLVDKLTGPNGHEIDEECGYPPDITPLLYHLLYQRDGIAHRTVEFMPQEAWALDPLVYEDEDPGTETPFEKDWNDVLERLNCWYRLHQIDEQSGIGRFGVLLLGLDDNKQLSEPAEGYDLKTGQPTKGGRKNKLLFLRPFSEVACQVSQRETNQANPRFGQPTMYLLQFRELDVTEPITFGTTIGGISSAQVHWTRVIHVADNRQMSEIYGTPRMKQHFNRILDVRKIMGGSAEMFWKGAFPGISFELNPGVGDQQLDEEALREEIHRYERGLQRYLAVSGLTAKSLEVQMADPKGHVDVQMEQIAFGIGCPKRIFFGSEEAKLASNTDKKTWNTRVARRNDKYTGPMLVRPFVDRLIALKVVRPPKKEKYIVYWPDLSAPTEMERAQLALVVTQATQAYVQGGVSQIIPPELWLTMVQQMDPEQVEEVQKAMREANGGRRTGPGAGPDPTVEGDDMLPGQLGRSVEGPESDTAANQPESEG